MKRTFACVSICLAALQMVSAQVLINEIMQSNIDCIMDDLNEFPDSWVELYNSSSSAVQLSGYRLGVSNNPEEAYALPSFSLKAGGYQLVYADKDEGSNSWHTPFRLESGKGCCVYLFKGTEVVDSITDLKKQPAPNVAYGRATDGGSKYGYLRTPTPGEANGGDVCSASKILSNPVFSKKGQVFESSTSFTLTITMPEGTPSGTALRYTIDGSEPTETSTVFPQDGIEVSSTSVIKAKPFCSGYLSPRATAHSYIFLGRTMTLPVVSITTHTKYLTNSKIGIYVDGTYQDGKKNYTFDWRRPVNIELFDKKETKSVLNQLCEVRIQGGATRSNKLKSLALYANKRFGEKRFDYEFFPEDRPKQTNFKSLLLRNAGNDFDYLYLRDAIIQRTMAKHVDLDWQAWRPAIVFINGEYKGIESFRERSNDSNIFTNYDGLEDVTVVENWSDVKDGGKAELFNEFKAFYNDANHTLAEYEQVLDVNEFLNVMVAQVYFNNLDAPGNNFTIWRPNAEGGRWRALMKDMDFTMNLYGVSYNYKYLDWLYNPSYDSDHNWGANSSDGTRLFRRLMSISEFRDMFLDRLFISMGDYLNLGGVWSVWGPMYNTIKTEYPTHRALFNAWWPNYNNEMSNAKTWLSSRTPFMYTYLCEYYNLGSLATLWINRYVSSADLEKIKVTVNDVPLSDNSLDGKFPVGRTIRLKGENVSQWTVEYQQGAEFVKKVYTGSTLSFTVPNCSLVEISATVDNTLGIDQLSEEPVSGETGIYDANGRKLTTLQKGLNIVVKRMGDRVISEKIMY